jgi:prolyl oligopeptidase
MNLIRLIIFAGCLLTIACASKVAKTSEVQSSTDPYLWLEEMPKPGATLSPEVLKWVKAHDEKSSQQLMTDPNYKKITDEIRPIALAKDRIPMVSIKSGKYRNFWQDEDHVRGIVRQTTPLEFVKTTPKWDTILDIDALNKKENKSWVFEGNNCLPPAYTTCLASLSNGGGDKAVVREFDVLKKEFVEGGFELPEGKSNVGWIDKDTLFLGADFGPGTLTSSGYPKQVRIWKRGTPFTSAKLIFEGSDGDVSVSAGRSFKSDSRNDYVNRQVTFFESENYFLTQKNELKKIPFPSGTEFQGDFHGFLLGKLRKDWQTAQKTFKAGSVVSLPLNKILDPHFSSSVEVVYEPNSRSTLSEMSTSKNFILLGVLNNVRGEIYQVSRNDNHWAMSKIPLPNDGAISIEDANDFDNQFFVTYQSFASPPTLYYGDLTKAHQGLKKVKALAPKYNSTDVVLDQFEATSKDGTKAPYFVVHKKSMVLDGNNPTLLYGYGGFEISMTPYYLGSTGKVWTEKGGVFVLANIRGGGEFGPQWHEAALNENRQRAYDDFAAVTQDLFTRKITSPKKLGIQGGSNGGLLMGVAFTQHPDYYEAVVCESALLDMLRYTKLPPGASWIGEYGDPDDPKVASYISQYSPYQNLKPGVKYPKVFFHISTEDDRVQPGHTRKMVARMEEYGNDVLLYENIEGGHGGAADLEQGIVKKALEYTYLYQQLMP